MKRADHSCRIVDLDQYGRVIGRYKFGSNPRGWDKMRHYLASYFVAILARAMLIVAVLQVAFLAHAGTPKEEFIRSNIERAYRILTDESLSEEERNRQFRTFLRSAADIRRIALFTLGPHAQIATECELDAFVHSFEDYLVIIYGGLLSKYRDNPIKVSDSVERRPGDFIINGELSGTRGANSPIKIAFRVRVDANGKDFLVDLAFDGIWLAVIQKEDFTSFLRAHDGDLGLLAEELGKRAAKFAAGGQRLQDESGPAGAVASLCL